MLPAKMKKYFSYPVNGCTFMIERYSSPTGKCLLDFNVHYLGEVTRGVESHVFAFTIKFIYCQNFKYFIFGTITAFKCLFL